jgi:hypothetical protein
VDLPGRGSVGRDLPLLHPPPSVSSPLAWVGPILVWFRAPDKMTACGERKAVGYPACTFPRGSLSSVAAKYCSVEISGNKTAFVA